MGTRSRVIIETAFLNTLEILDDLVNAYIASASAQSAPPAV
jgi:hypothetical protein